MLSTNIYSKLLPYFLLIPLLLASCGGFKINENSTYEEIELDFSKTDSISDISNYVESVNIIPIEDKPGNLVGEISKVIKISNGYILFDNVIAKRIIAVDLNGKFIKNVVDIGQGKEKIMQLNDCWIDIDSNLHVYDFSQNIILTFDNLLNYEKTEVFGDDLVFTSLSNIPSSNKIAGAKGYLRNNPPDDGKYYKFVIMDKKGENLKYSQFYYDKDLNDALLPTTRKTFSNYENLLLYSQKYDPNIYSVDSVGLSLHYKIIYKNNPLPLNFDKELLLKNLDLLKIKDNKIDMVKINEIFLGYSGFSGNWLESKDYIYFESFDKTTNQINTLFDKKKKKIITMSNFFAVKNNDMKISPYFSNVDPANNTYYSVHSGADLIRMFSKKSPMYNLFKDDLEANYIINVKLKD